MNGGGRKGEREGGRGERMKMEGGRGNIGTVRGIKFLKQSYQKCDTFCSHLANQWFQHMHSLITTVCLKSFDAVIRLNGGS